MFGTLPPFNPVSPSAVHRLCSAEWPSVLVSASSSPCGLSKGGRFAGQGGREGGGGLRRPRTPPFAHGQRIQSDLTATAKATGCSTRPCGSENLLVSQVSSLARLRKVAGTDERSCQDIITAGSLSPNEFLPTTEHEQRRHKFVSTAQRASG